VEHLEALESIHQRARRFPRGPDGVQREQSVKKTRQTCLFRELNKVLSAIVRASAGLKECANGEEGEKDFEDCATWVVLMGGLDVASDDMRTGYFKKSELCLDEGIREKSKEGI